MNRADLIARRGELSTRDIDDALDQLDSSTSAADWALLFCLDPVNSGGLALHYVESWFARAIAAGRRAERMAVMDPVVADEGEG